MKITNDSPSARIPSWLLATDVPALSIRVFALLDSRLSDGRRLDLAEKCGVSVRTVDSALAELERVGAVGVVITPGSANEYVLHDRGPLQLSLVPVQPVAGVRSVHIEKRAREVRTNGLERRRTKEPKQIDLSSSHFSLCRLLAARVAENTGREPRIGVAWVEAMERLLRIDGAPVDEVRRVIDWATRDEFWAPNILSPQKLRKQYPSLKMRMQRGSGGRRRNVTGAQLREIADKLEGE